MVFEIDIHTPVATLQERLKQNGWLHEGEILETLETPGDGNMNVVIRVRTNRRSFILKQSRPYVRKYKEIDAPLQRIAVECRFYRSMKDPLGQAHFPRILAYDPSHYLLQLEDLGDCRDMTYWYETRSIDEEAFKKLIDILGIIHAQDPDEDFPSNLELRRLNHQHIFVLPFSASNDFSLDTIQPGLHALSIPYRDDAAIRQVADRIGEMYLAPGKVLLHGDYYPGSWMTKKHRVYVIDPEFSFPGFAEFDLGVMAAHAVITTGDRNYVRDIVKEYQGTARESLVMQVAGIEILRRLIGRAQLPLERTLEEKEYLLKMARQMILQ